MQIEINKILDSSPRKRVLILINHQADIAVSRQQGFLSQDEIKTIVASFKTDKELKFYSKYRELFKKAQFLLAEINQSHLAYKADLQYLDKLIILKTIQDDLSNIQSNDEETLKIARLFEDVRLTNTLNGNLISGYKEILKRRQAGLKSAIQAFKDANKEYSLNVKAFERFISSIEEQQNDAYSKKLFESLLVDIPDYKSIEVNFEQYKKYKEMYL